MFCAKRGDGHRDVGNLHVHSEGEEVLPELEAITSYMSEVIAPKVASCVSGPSVRLARCMF